VTAGHVGLLVEPFRTSPDTQVSTLCIRATPEEVDARQVNKVVFGAGGRALYFSKYGIPFDRDNRGAVRYKHVGLYAYRKDALEVFHRLPPSTLERAEGLEQLRFLEHGVPITVRETTEPTIGIDTEEDLRAAEAPLAARPGAPGGGGPAGAGQPAPEGGK
jgi:3-deoxy-manno-octulosonate cytidylyltransferase (CMP-KDO synthetase)